MPAAAGELDEILTAMAAWERAAWEVNPLAPQFWAYATVPSQAELDAGLRFPHTIHVPQTGTYKAESLNQSPTMEETDTDTFSTYLVLAKDVNDLASQLGAAARWKRTYRRAFVKAMRGGLGGLVTPDHNAMSTYEIGAWDLFGMVVVGVRFPITVRTRPVLDTV